MARYKKKTTRNNDIESQGENISTENNLDIQEDEPEIEDDFLSCVGYVNPPDDYQKNINPEPEIKKKIIPEKKEKPKKIQKEKIKEPVIHDLNVPDEIHIPTEIVYTDSKGKGIVLQCYIREKTLEKVENYFKNGNYKDSITFNYFNKKKKLQKLTLKIQSFYGLKRITGLD